MAWLTIVLGYLIGSLPTAYIAGRMTRGIDIRQVGDENMGAANAYRHLSPTAGVIVFLIDLAKGALAVLMAQAFNASQVVVLLTGLAAVAGHNWPLFLGFRGGRGLSTAIGVLLILMTRQVLILGGPAMLTLAVRKDVSLSAAVLFVPLPILCWLTGLPALLIIYSIIPPCLVGFTHALRMHRKLPRKV